MAANSWDPALAGYGPRESAMIQRAIYEFANRRNIKVWTEQFHREIKQMELTSGYGPRVTYEGSRPYVVPLYITKPDGGILERRPRSVKMTWYSTGTRLILMTFRAYPRQPISTCRSPMPKDCITCLRQMMLQRLLLCLSPAGKTIGVASQG